MKLNYIKVFIPLLVILLGIFIWTNQNNPATNEVKPKALAKMYSVDTGQVTSLEFTNQHGTARMEFVDGRWKMTVPGDFTADTPQVDTFIAGILDTIPDRVLTQEEAADPAEYGVSNPQATLSFGSGTSQLLQLNLGKVNTTGSSYYAQINNDGTVVMLPTVGVESHILGADPNDFRSRHVMHFNSEKVQKIEIEYPETGDFYTVERRPNGWQVTHPFEYRGRERKIDAVFIHLEDLKVANFTDTPRASAGMNPGYGLAPPKIRLSLMDDRNQVQRLDIGVTTGELSEVYATATALPEVFTTQQHIIDKLTWTDEEIKEDRLVVFHKNSLGEVEVRLRGADNLVITKEAGNWIRKEPTDLDVEEERALEFIQSVLSLAPASYLTPDEAAEIDEDDLGFSEYTLKIELKKADTFKEQILTIGKLHRTHGFYTRDSASDGVYLLREEQVKEVQRQIDLIRGGDAPSKRSGDKDNEGKDD